MTSYDLFTPITQKRVSDEAVEQICKLIDAGELKPGARLPSERDLTRRLSISRTALREAIRLLEAQKVVEVLPGRGTFILEVTEISGLPSRWGNWLRDHQSEVIDLLQIRRELEPFAASLATQRADKEALSNLGSTLANATAAIGEGNVKAAVEADVQFHELISEMARNPFLIELNKSINSALMESRYAYYSIPARAEASKRQHRAVFQAIRSRNPELAEEAMYAHIESTLEFILSLRLDGR